MMTNAVQRHRGRLNEETKRDLLAIISELDARFRN